MYNENMKNIILNETPKIKKAIEYIKSTNFNNMPDGKINLDNEIWANLQTYYTKEDALFEAHRKYIDIQFMLSGQEKISVCEYSACKSSIPYDEDKDIEFLTSETFDDIEMHTGDFLILYPNDAHKPSINFNGQHHVRKLVVKVPVD